MITTKILSAANPQYAPRVHSLEEAMDVVIVKLDGEEYPVEIGFFDTVLEMKERIERYHHIPVGRQTLYFNAARLEDDKGTEFYKIVEGSRIQLLVEQSRGEDEPVPTPRSQPFELRVRDDATNSRFTVKVGSGVTIRRLKEEIQKYGYSAPPFALWVGLVELEDHKTAADYELTEESEIRLVPMSAIMSSAAPPHEYGGLPDPVLPPSTASGSSAVVSRATVSVVAPHISRNRKMNVKVVVQDKVMELRRKIDSLPEGEGIELPEYGYFLVHNGKKMNEQHTFEWHGVLPDDQIQVLSMSHRPSQWPSY